MGNPTTDVKGLEPTWREKSAARRCRVGINLYTRFTLCCFAVGAMTAALMFLIQSPGSAPDPSGKEVTRYGKSIATAIGKAGQLDLRAGERGALQQLAEQSVGDGVVSVVTFMALDERPIASAGKAVSGSNLTVRVPVTDEGIAWRAQSNPSQIIGFVEVGLVPAAPLPVQPIGQQMAWVLAGALAISGVLATLFIKNAFRPLRELIDVTRRIEEGDVTCLAPSSRVPLFGAFAASLNSLTRRICADRSAFQQAETRLKAANDDLETKLANRTLQLEAANGRLTGEIAEKEDFLRAISHDLNAPLRNIGGMVTMLLAKNRSELSEDAQGRLERIRKNVDVETDLINELLELSRIKTRHRNLTLVDTEALMWELRGMFENDLKTLNINLVLETSLPPLYGDRPRIRQVFQNLLDNAIKYMGDSTTREIRVGCRCGVAEAEFYVRDTGVGIHPDDIQKVFYVFRRGRGEVTHKIPGKGVGLASAKSIVETYSGRIWVESELGAGTTFRFTINGKYVPAVSGQIPDELEGKSVPTPGLAA